MVAAVAAVESTLGATTHAYTALRHRKLKKQCLNKGMECTAGGTRCCGGNVVCQEGVCCLPDDEQGCDSEDPEVNFCCSGICNVTSSTCCAEGDDVCFKESSIPDDQCVTKGNLCANADECCGGLSCEEVLESEWTCCLDDYLQGCELGTEYFCCSGICNVTTSTCCPADDTDCFDAGAGNEVTCFPRGEICDEQDQCCGGMGCEDTNLDGDKTCCIPLSEQGCEENLDCCEDGVCITEKSRCCALGDVECELAEQIPCQIHGLECNVTGDTTLDNSCCGEVKYKCEYTGIAFDEDVNDGTCCIPIGNLGCGFDVHCCFEEDDFDTKCELQRCVFLDGTWPDDDDGGAQGDPDCSNKNGYCCISDDDFTCDGGDFICCGMESPDSRLACEENACCIVANVSGCEFDDDCCSGLFCNTTINTCME